MRANNTEFTKSEFSPEIAVSFGLTSFVTEIIGNIKRLAAGMRRERAKARLQPNRKRKMQKQIYQDTIDRMTVEQKLSIRNYRL